MTWRARYPRRHIACAGVIQRRFLRLALLAFFAGAGGCASWEGRLDRDFERQVDERLDRITQTRLKNRSSRAPLTIEQGMEKQKERRGGTTSAPADAPQTLRLSVGAIREETLRNNLDLQVVVLEPRIARTKVSEERAKFDATISLGASYKKSDLPELDGPTVQLKEQKSALDRAIGAYELSQQSDGMLDKVFGKAAEKALLDYLGARDGNLTKVTEVSQRKEDAALGAGISVPLPTGGVASLRQAFDQNNKLSPVFSDQSLSGTKLTFSQPLLRNAGVDVNNASIRIARLGEKATIAQTKLAAIKILAASEKAYWRVYAARRQLEVRERLAELAHQQLELVERRATEGLSAPIEIVRAEVGVAKQQENLIVAQTIDRLVQRDLKRIVNIENVEVNSDTRIIPETDPELVQYSLDANALADEAVVNRMEMLELELELAADKVRIDFARNQVLPLITLDFEYGLAARGGSLGTAWENTWGYDTGTYGMGIRGEIPVTNEAREAQLRRAKLQRTKRLSTRAARELSIRQEVCDAVDVLNQNWQRILATRRTVIASDANYIAEQKQFEQGKRTMREVFEALGELGEAQLREIAAVVEYQVSLIDLAFATGTLLGYSDVDVGGIDYAQAAP